MSYLDIRNLRKTFGVGARRTAVLENFSLTVEQGEFVALYGRLGDGKTTLAALIAGLTLPDYGAITLAGKCVSGPGPDRALVSQANAPLAWLTVRENVIAAIDGVFESTSQRRARADYYLQTLGLADSATKKPAELAEPLRRRLALARALAVNPDVLLLDDPLCGLEDEPRERLAVDLARLVLEETKTCLLFTSNVDEALLLADRVVPLARDTRSLPVKEYHIDIPRPRKAPKLTALAHLRAALLGSFTTAAGFS